MNYKWLENIKVGDKVIVHSGGPLRNDCIDIVERLTKTQIILSKTSSRFRREDGDVVGEHSMWNTTYLKEAKQDDIDNIITNNKLRKLNRDISSFTNIKDLPIESLEKVWKVMCEVINDNV